VNDVSVRCSQRRTSGRVEHGQCVACTAMTRMPLSNVIYDRAARSERHAAEPRLPSEWLSRNRVTACEALQRLHADAGNSERERKGQAFHGRQQQATSQKGEGGHGNGRDRSPPVAVVPGGRYALAACERCAAGGVCLITWLHQDSGMRVAFPGTPRYVRGCAAGPVRRVVRRGAKSFDGDDQPAWGKAPTASRSDGRGDLPRPPMSPRCPNTEQPWTPTVMAGAASVPGGGARARY